MFAVVRTGGKQYRVAAGDKIVVEKIGGDTGDSVKLDDVLLAGEGSELKPTDGLTVAAEIIAQAQGEKVIVFKKRRRHNYRRKNGHRQQHTILRITAIGAEKAKASQSKADTATAKKADTESQDTPAEKAAPAKKAAAKPATTETAAKKAPAEKPAAKKAAPKADKA